LQQHFNYIFLYEQFYKNTKLTFAQNLSLKFSVEGVNKTVESAAPLAKCILLHAHSCTTARAQTKTSYLAYLTSWHNSIFGYKLRTIQAVNP